MDFDIEILKKFYRGECSIEEEKKIIAWFSDQENEDSILSTIELNWYRFEFEEDDKQKVISTIKSKVNSRIGRMKEINRREFKLNIFILKIAAVLTFLIVASIIFRKYTNDSRIEATALSVNHAIKTTSKGQKLQTHLSDGSSVFLNSESKISYHEANFVDSIRAVYLDGEAYFQVAENAEVPFVVSTSNLTITALGTSFSVRTYADDSSTYVALETGRVSLEKISMSSGEQEVIHLNPGELIVYNKEKNHFSPGKYFYDEHIGWKNGLLLFNEDNLSDVIRKLERWYNVEIVVVNQEQSPKWNYSGRFMNVTLLNVLEGMSYTKSFEFDIKGQIVYINFRN